MSVLNITTDTAGKVLNVKVDDKLIPNVSNVTQSLTRGQLTATVTATFDSIVVTEQAGTPAPALTATFAAGTVVGSTKATVTGAGSGNHFAYKVGTASGTPNVDDVITGSTTYVSDNNITGVATGNNVSLYELTADNKVVKYLAHTLVANEVKQS